MAFEQHKTIQYWLDCAQYDLDTGKSLLDAKRFPYALFFAHLALEKRIKSSNRKINSRTCSIHSFAAPFSQ